MWLWFKMVTIVTLTLFNSIYILWCRWCCSLRIVWSAETPRCVQNYFNRFKWRENKTTQHYWSVQDGVAEWKMLVCVTGRRMTWDGVIRWNKYVLAYESAHPCLTWTLPQIFSIQPVRCGCLCGTLCLLSMQWSYHPSSTESLII